jgi:filamentous hemagglutinin family protein
MMKHRRHLLLLASTAMTVLASPLAAGPPAPPASATLPQGGTVQAGSASFSTSGSTLTVNQSSNSAIINWNTFNIGAGGTVRINMPSSTSVELDRVTGNLGPSQIFGTLSSNGIVFLVNPNGILFGQGSQVNVGALLATTHDIKNSDFMAGKYRFHGAGNASVVNEGSITAASGGFAALVAPGVRNSGTITATLGTVGLTAGNGFTLDMYGDKLITLGVNESIAKQVMDVATGQPLSSLVTNTGKLSANGGKVQITAAAARMVLDSVINTSGVIEANSIGQHNGTITLAASTKTNGVAQKVRVSGKLLAKGTKSGESGGNITITGEDIKLSHAKVDASGQAGGGTVMIGIDVPQISQYMTPAFTASVVDIDRRTVIDASGEVHGSGGGNGGTIAIWADDKAKVDGTLIAKGGGENGQGGFAAVFGVQTLAFGGSANLASGNNANSDQSGNGSNNNGNNLLLASATDITVTSDPRSLTPGTSYVTVNALEKTLATTSVNVSAGIGNIPFPGFTSNGSLTVASNIAWSSPSSLSLSANQNITIDSGVTITNTSALTYPSLQGCSGSNCQSITLDAGQNGLGTGTVTFGSGALVDVSNSNAWVGIQYNPSGGYTNPTDYSPFILTSNNGPNFTAAMIVNTAAQLELINQNTQTLAASYALVQNIDLSSIANFVPIGNAVTPFTGNFSGNGNNGSTTISGLTITSNPGGGPVGLFGQIGTSGSCDSSCGGGYVWGVTLTNVNIAVSGASAVGAIAGINYGSITQSAASGSVSNTGAGAVGGLVGINGVPAFNCNNCNLGLSGSTASVNVTGGNGAAVGGAVGLNLSSVSSVTSSGTVIAGGGSDIGGLVGDNAGSVTQSSASGDVRVAHRHSGDVNIGGLVGLNESAAIISSSSASGNVWGGRAGNLAGGLVGLNVGDIFKSSATGNVSGSGYYQPARDCNECSGHPVFAEIGGLVGENEGSVKKSESSGAVTGGSYTIAGGLVGENAGRVIKSQSSATVNASDRHGGAKDSTFGGLVGVNESDARIVNSSASGDVNGGTRGNIAGGLVGQNLGDIYKSWASGNVSGSGYYYPPSDCDECNGRTFFAKIGGLVGVNGSRGEDGSSANIFGSFATGTVNGGSYSVAGGLVGKNYATVQQSYAAGAVTGSTAGGLVGVNKGRIEQAYAMGAVTGTDNAGGLVGYNGYSGTITQTYATGVVTGGDGTNVGGLVGYNNGAIYSSFWDTTINPLISGVGYGNTSGVMGIITADFDSIATFQSAGWVFGTSPGGKSCNSDGGACWVVVDADGGLNNQGGTGNGATRPMLLSEWSTTITNAHQLQLMELDPTAHYKLANDINLGAALSNPSDVWGPNGAAGFVPIGTNGNWFTGTFNGGGYAISGLTIAPIDPNVQSIGLFGTIGVGGVVKNLTLTDATITIDPNVTAPGEFVGVLAGQNAGLIKNVTIDGTSSINGLSDVSLNFGILAGGLVGQNGTFGPGDAQSAGTIKYSNADVSVTLGDGCSGDCNGGMNYAGGLVGMNPGVISHSSASGTIVVGSNAIAGGLVGTNGNYNQANNAPIAGAVISHSFATGTVSSAGVNVSLGGLVGQNQAFSVIRYAKATGAVTSTATFINQDCGDGGCQGADAGGLVGQNSGIISHARASGDVMVGSYSNAGGLVGTNGQSGQDGSSDAAARISHSYASGTVGSAGVNVSLGGLVGQNKPDAVIAHSAASGAVTSTATISSQDCQDGCQFVAAGGLVGVNQGEIYASRASGDVVVGSYSFAGGLVGYNGNPDNGDSSKGRARISHSSASGTVSSAGVNVSLGGLVGENAALAVIVHSKAIGAVTSTAAIDQSSCPDGGCLYVSAGGLVGQNAGAIYYSRASGDVTVGSWSAAGGLVGYNGNFNSDGSPIRGARISYSSASGAVASGGVNVALGGLVGVNASLAIIKDSRATGAVTGTANLATNTGNCSSGSDCQYENVGGLVGQNSGTIKGKAWDDLPVGCTAGYTCATGAVTVGSEGSAGGLVGYNNGIIKNAFVINTVVTGASGSQGTTGHQFDNQTSLGGLVGTNQGTITNAFATGTVGTAGVQYLQVGGFVGDNAGTISNSFANVTVVAGDNSVGGGFAGSNSTATTPNTQGDGYNNLVTITNSTASGTVTLGASSVAGGFAGYGLGTFTNVTANGAVIAGGNSTVGGLVGALDVGGMISGSTAQNTLVASTGASSTIGGLVGVNGGTVTTSASYSPVSGGANSNIGGLVGANFGTVTSSFVDPTVTGTGGNDNIGGLAGLNVGTLGGNDPTQGNTAQNLVLVSNGTGSQVGGIAGVNGTYVYTGSNPFTPGSSSQTGTYQNSTATGTGFTAPVGSSTPTSPPSFPNWVPNCTVAVCNGINDGSFQTTSGGGDTGTGNTGGVTGNYGTQQTTNLTQIPTFTTDSSPPVITPITLGPTGGTGGAGGTGGTGGNGGAGGNGGNGGTTGSVGKWGGNGAPPGTRLIDMPVIPLPPGSGMPPPGETHFREHEVVFQIGNGASLQQVEAIARQFGLTVVASDPLGILGRTVYTFNIPDGRSVRDIIRAIEAAKLSAWVGPVYTYGLTDPVAANPPAPAATAPASIPADPDAEIGDPAQYVIEKFHLGESHQVTRGDNVIVAVIDSEIDSKHPDLAGVVTSRYDAGCGATPPDAHGTGMTGAIASRKNLMGVAPNVKVIAICAFGGESTGESTSIKIIKGLDYAISQGARVINMSFAGPRDPALAQALQIAREKGVVLIGAAGNAGPKSPPLYPGADPNVIAVTATDDNDRLFKGANQGKYIAVAAPGVDILVPAPNEGVQLTTGTSVATAEVSGVAALLIAQQPSRTPDEIRNILMSTAKDLGPKGIDPQFGAGLVDPLKALRLAPARVSQKSASLRAPPPAH